MRLSLCQNTAIRALHFAVDIALPEMQSDEHDEDYYREKNIEYCGLTMDDRGLLHTSQARAMDGRILYISKEDIAEIIAMNGSKYFLDTQTGAEDPPSIDDAAAPSIDGHFGSRRSTLHQNMKRTPHWESTEKRLDDIYYPFDNSISWLTTHTNEMKQDIAILQKPHTVGAGRSKSITTHAQPSIDTHIQASIDARLTSFEDRLQSFTYRLDGVYYALHNIVDSLTTWLDAVKQEMDTIQRQLDSQAGPSPSIDRRTRPSIDDDYAALRNKLVTEKSLLDKLDEITFHLRINI
ncbi:hypothetical protein F2Q69_00013716 [Brassica cretica]|uniref:Uncharacterized protein n=1 Tax=Brassica cretica TaxID=69181 RepID=A0A8S9QQZ2_BRACR|nr:hypothetical protein F2Q69_00013716 [Brassica cretica]